MQTTNKNDSMMSDFFQVEGYSNFGSAIGAKLNPFKGGRRSGSIGGFGNPLSGGGLSQMVEQLRLKQQEKKVKEALELKEAIKREEEIEERIINEQNIGSTPQPNSPVVSPTPSANKVPYLYIGIGAVALIGITVLLVKKS